MIILDSCVWIAFLNEEDSLNKRAEDLFAKLDFNTVMMPNLVLYEVLTILKLKSGLKFKLPKAFLKLLEGLGVRASDVPEKIMEASTETLVNISQKNSFMDVCLYEWSKIENVQIITFDESLKKWIAEK